MALNGIDCMSVFLELYHTTIRNVYVFVVIAHGIKGDFILVFD